MYKFYVISLLYLGGTEDGFVQMMNANAQELGMNDTTFKNCHGLDEDDHLTISTRYCSKPISKGVSQEVNAIYERSLSL